MYYRKIGILVIIFLFNGISYSQMNTSTEKSNSYNWNISITGGVTHNFDDGISQHISLSYLEYGAGYLLNDNHEIGIKIGHNEFFSTGQLRIIALQYSNNDTIAIYGSIPELYKDIWYGAFYKFNYRSWYGSILLGATSGFDYEYTGISIGKDFEISKIFNLNVGLNYALKTNEYKRVYSKQLSLLGSFIIKL